MGGNMMCNFCCEYRECFDVIHKNAKLKFGMCYRCAYSYNGTNVWRVLNDERMKENEKQNS